MAKVKTSWGDVADWYGSLLEGEGTYQKDLILPNILRLLSPKKGEVILDLACGTGFFAERFAAVGARVIGADISPELIGIAQKNSEKVHFKIDYRVLPADNLKSVNDNSADKITIILALQNIENAQGALKECGRVLKNGGTLHIVLNHPAFRIPRASSWGWDDENKIQYRRIDRYLSQLKEKIQMHPGDKPGEYTYSFHRPLQFYFKAFNKAGFRVTRLEEWSSNRKSEPGPRAAAEDRTRAEIPLFLYLECLK